MKKTILLASLVATVASFAGTTGNVKFINENEHDITNKNFVVKKGMVSTEVKVDNSGLSFGGEFKVEDLKPFKDETTSLVALKNLKEHSSVFAKYELPTFKNINTYVKGTLKGEGKATIEGNAEYKLNELSLGANSATTFVLGKNFDKKDVESTHKVYAKGNVNKFKDIDAEIAVTHKYGEKAFQYVSGKLHGKYDFTEKLEGKLEFDATVAKYGTPSVKNVLKGGDIKLTNDGHSEALVLGVKSTHLAKTELTADAMLQFVRGVESVAGHDTTIERQLEIAKKEVKSLTEKLENSKDTKEIGKAPLTIDDYNQYNKEVEKLDKREKELAKILEERKALDKKYIEKSKKGLETKLTTKLTKAKKEVNSLTEKLENSKGTKEIGKAPLTMKDYIQYNEEVKKIYNSNKTPFQMLKEIEALDKKYIEKSKKDLETKLAKANKEVNSLTEKLENSKDIKEIGKAPLTIDDYNQYNKEVEKLDKREKELAKIPEERKALDKKYIEKSKKDLETKLTKAKEDVTDLTKKLDSVKPIITKTNTLYFGTKLGVKNTSIKNLTLTGDATFGGVREVKVVDDKALEPTLTGYVKLHAGALYDYKVTDKLTVSPEFNSTLTFDNINKDGADTKLVLEPKLSAKYDLTTDKKGLSISGNIAVPVKFENKEKKDFKYSNTTVKSAINVEYVW